MPNETPPTNSTPPVDDPNKNLKAEVDRKLDNVTQSLKDVQATNAALMAQLSKLTAPPPPKAEPEPDVKSLLYDDPDRAVSVITDKITKRVESAAALRDQSARKEATIIQELRDNYPELYDGTSELTRKAIDIFNKYPDEDKIPACYKLAVKEAAEQLGIVPASKRPESTSDYVAGPRGSRQPNGRFSKKAGVDPKTLDFARECGLNVDDPKVVESIEKRQRDGGDWMSYK